MPLARVVFPAPRFADEQHDGAAWQQARKAAAELDGLLVVGGLKFENGLRHSGNQHGNT